ncbi:ABC transporter ATP-binding protein [Plantibacter auratus]|uniref:ABC transporter ATP-binding protein n=1 Tax=Plantibacter auratus TaxID=272914 RepID=UPI003D358D1B
MTRPTLEVIDVTVGYAGKQALLTDWSAQFWPGEVVAITGPSGRGKSTLLYVLGLMLRMRSGSVKVEGLDTSPLGEGARASLRAHRYGFVFQDAVLDASRTIMENVLESSLYRNGDHAADLVRSRVLLERFGVNVPAEYRPGQVSGGQAQRIALCRALLGDPPILLADEPTGNLDHQSARTVLDAFREHAASGATVIVVTHDEAVVRTASRRIAL